MFWTWDRVSADGTNTYYRVSFGRTIIDSSVRLTNSSGTWYNGDGNPYLSQAQAKAAWEKDHKQ